MLGGTVGITIMRRLFVVVVLGFDVVEEFWIVGLELDVLVVIIFVGLNVTPVDAVVVGVVE